MIKPIKTINKHLESSLVKELAINLGFDNCGISTVQISNTDIQRLDQWLDAGAHAEMNYMSKNIEIRNNPRLLVDEAKSVISVTLNYTPEEEKKHSKFYIAKYARGLDYHYVMKSKLRLLLGKLEELYPEINARVFTDSAPVLERALSRDSGLGFIGKNTCLIHPQMGSFFFIGEIICDYVADYDSPIDISCGNCSICIDSCPIGALSNNGLDANKCISYHTIENSGDIPLNIADKITNQAFGCDICQNVCPYNKKVPITTHQEFNPLEKIQELNVVTLEEMTNSQFNKRFSDTSLARVGRKKLIANYKLIQSKINL